jgi:hypothetical protein
MANREVLLCDIPDEFQPVADYFDEIRSNYPEVSRDSVLGEIEDLKIYGPIAAGCLPTADGMWRLTTVLGYGRKSNLILYPLKNGNYLAVHGFVSSDNADIERGLMIATKRKANLD